MKGLAAVSPNNPAGTVSRDYYSENREIMSYETSISQAIQEAKIGSSRLQRVTASKLPNFVQPEASLRHFHFQMGTHHHLKKYQKPMI